MDTLLQDTRFALRTLAKNRGFAFVAILTLALGIGASSAIFSVVDNVLMEPFPYKNADRLMSVVLHDQDKSGESGIRTGYSSSEFQVFASQNHVFNHLIGAAGEDILYKTAFNTQHFDAAHVTPGTFELFGVPALLGRLAQPADYEPGAPPVFLLRYKIWVTHFNADPSILDKTFVLNGTPRTLIGIMPPRFGWYDAELFIPEKPTASTAAIRDPLSQDWFLLGDLKPGVSKSQAASDLTVIAKHLAEIRPADYPKHLTAQARPLGDGVIGRFRTTLYMLFAAVGLLLLIGCANVANLMLARAMTREKEFALRAVLGAGRLRLMQQLLVESSLLAAAGAALGILLAWGGLKFIVFALPQDSIPTESVIQLNGLVLAFTLALAVLTAVLFGLGPALQAARRDLNDPLRDSGKGLGGAFRSARLRDVVVVLEVALSLILLCGAGLVMRSFIALREVPLGFQPDHVLVALLPLPADRYHTAAQVSGFYRPLLARLQALPGVVTAAEASALPPYGGIPTDIDIPGTTHEDRWTALFQLCSQEYFTVLRMQFLEGRGFTEAEVDGARKVAVVNQTFARRYLRGRSSILGQRVHLAQLETFTDPVRDAWFEIIGVIPDAKNQGLQDPVEPDVWIPYTLSGSATHAIMLRTSQDPLSLMDSMRHEVWATDSNVVWWYANSLQAFINSYSYAGPRFSFFVMVIFAAVGLVLVLIGIYSMLAYITARKTHEIGIRLALGAEGSNILALVVTTGLRLVLAGLTIGLVVSFALGRVIASQLWQISPGDPLTLTSMSLLLLLTGIAACWIPARRAAKVDPLVALRYE